MTNTGALLLSEAIQSLRKRHIAITCENVCAEIERLAQLRWPNTWEAQLDRTGITTRYVLQRVRWYEKQPRVVRRKGASA